MHIPTLLALIDDTAINIPRTQTSTTQIGTILQFVFALAGAISVIVITVAGLNYVISNGDPQKTARAKDTILYAIVGLVISILAVTIVTFVIGKLF